MRKFIPFIVIVIFSGLVFGQSVNARNYLDYRGAKSGHSYFEDRANINLGWNDFSAGLVYWARQPSRFNYTTNSDTTFSDITQYWFNFYSKNLQLTAGSFTYTMGMGLLIDLYEKQDIQIDHHCDGAMFDFELGPLELSGFNAIAKWDDNSIVRGISPSLKIWKLKLGGEYAKIIPTLLPSQELSGGFLSFDWNFLSLYGEYGKKHPLAGLEKDGDGVFASASILTDIITLTAEYKDYNEFAIRNTFVQYNNPPTLVMDPLYTLPSRHIHHVDFNNEMGYSADLLGDFGSFGAEIMFSHSENHDGDLKFDKIWSELEYRNDALTFLAKGAFDFQNNNGENAYTPIVDITYEPDWTKFGFNIIGEFQHTDDFDNVYSSISASYPKYATFGLESGIIEDENFVRVYTDIDIINRTKIRFGYGKRPGGFTCSGGVCRYEEAFEGIEAQIIITY
ncbi:hypothetical protein J7L68_09985 [bacterium]|nr:hypothetical protein [bacterium]